MIKSLFGQRHHLHGSIHTMALFVQGIALILNANLTVKDAKPLVEFADTVYMMFGKTHDIAGKSSDAATIAGSFWFGC